MANKSSVFTILILAAFALAGVISLSTCATQKKGGNGPRQAEGPPADTAKHAAPVHEASAEPTPKVDERLTPIIADLVNKFEQHQAISAAIKTVLAVAAQSEGTTQGTGTYECKMQDGKRLIRVFLANQMSLAANGTVYTTEEYIDDWYDGKYLYKQLQQHRLKQVTKKVYAPSEILQIGGRDAFRPLTEGYNLKLLGEEAVNDAPAHVIEATPIGGNSKSKHYFDKATGIRVKQMEFNAAGETRVDITLSDIKLNPEFREDNFSPGLRADYQLIDETVPVGPQP